MAVINPYISIVTINVNVLNTTIKRNRAAGRIKTIPNYSLPTEDLF